MTLIIKGGTIVNRNGEQRADVAIEGERIVGIDEALDTTGATVLDAAGCIVTSGLVDLHTHMREPGNEDAETIETASRAAALGGYTAVVAMPNTNPTIDSLETVKDIRRESERVGLCEVSVAASITIGRKGERLSPMRELGNAGVRMFTDDGSGVQSAGVMRDALRIAAELDLTLAQHCEDVSLSGTGQMNAGPVADALGVAGTAVEAEDVMVMRDIALARATGARIHFQHLSTAGAVAMVVAARAQGMRVTAEVTPHHLSMTDEMLKNGETVFKVNPPLRSDLDREAVVAALVSGGVEAIATDHAPHTSVAKAKPFAEAPCGMLGLETAFGVSSTHLDVPVTTLLGLMSWQPSVIAGLQATQGCDIAPGFVANIAIIDPSAVWTVDADQLASKSRNTPYVGWQLTGRVRHTIYKGEPVVIDGEAQR